MRRRRELNGSSSFPNTVDQPCHKKVDPLPQPRLPLPAMALGSGPKLINLSGLWKFSSKPAPPEVLHIYSVSSAASTEGCYLHCLQFQLGFPKGLLCCSVGIDKMPRIKAAPTFSAFKCANIFSLPSLLVPSCLADICPHQQPCTCGGSRGRSMIPWARAALASVGRSNAPTSTSALELFVRCGVLALLRLATTAPVYRKKSHPTLRKSKCAHQQLKDWTS